MRISRQSFIEMAAGIEYLGLIDDKAVFKIGSTTYSYTPDDDHKDTTAWDQEIRSQIGTYNKTGTALNYVKKTSSGFDKKTESNNNSTEDLSETTTTSGMSLELVDTSDYDKSHDKNHINDKPEYNKDGEVVR